MALEVVSGGDQKGLAGYPLPEPVVLRVSDFEGRPLSDVPVHLQLLDGGGTLSATSIPSDSRGLVSAGWTLGGPELPSQHLTASLPGARSGSSVTIEATAVAAGDADVVVVRKASGPIRGVVILEETVREALKPVQSWASPDTIVPLHPLGPGDFDVLVFPQDDSPEYATFHWTEGVDTTVVELRPKLAIPLRIEVHEGPFDTRLAIIEEQLAVAREEYAAAGLGVSLGPVSVVDLTAAGNEINVTVEEMCRPSTELPLIIVRYVHSIEAGRYAGFACQKVVYMAERARLWPGLLAHEVGHLFSLQHRAVGVMADPPGEGLTEGEVFRAHFHKNSIINRLFGHQPPATRRLCTLTPWAPCLPLDFEVGAG